MTKTILTAIVVLSSSLSAWANQGAAWYQGVEDNQRATSHDFSISTSNAVFEMTNIESNNKEIMSDYSHYLSVNREYLKAKSSVVNQDFTQYQKKK